MFRVPTHTKKHTHTHNFGNYPYRKACVASRVTPEMAYGARLDAGSSSLATSVRIRYDSWQLQSFIPWLHTRQLNSARADTTKISVYTQTAQALQGTGRESRYTDWDFQGVHGFWSLFIIPTWGRLQEIPIWGDLYIHNVYMYMYDMHMVCI